MDESVTKHLEQKEKPSALLRRGDAMLGAESPHARYSYGSCALAAMYLAATGRSLLHEPVRGKGLYAAVARVTGLRCSEVCEVELKHFAYRKTRLQCAEWLESIGR